VPLARPVPAPPGIPVPAWAYVRDTQPGVAVAWFLDAHVGAALEEEGPNQSELLREWLYTPAGVDGQPYCAALPVSLLWAFGWQVPVRPGRHWFWHNRSVFELRRAFDHHGLLVGPNVRPRPGWFVFRSRRGRSDAGEGGHLDVVLDGGWGGDPVAVVGANVGDTIARGTVDLGQDDLLGFGSTDSLRRLAGEAGRVAEQ
jgi:hypothetical protein